MVANGKMKSGHQTLLEERQRLISMSTKPAADQRILEDSSRYWQSEAERTQGMIDLMA
jgi:hypothetical protein